MYAKKMSVVTSSMRSLIRSSSICATSAIATTNSTATATANIHAYNIMIGKRFMSKERAGKSIRPGANLVLDDVPHKVTKMVQGKRGKGGGFVRATLKNLINTNTFEKTFTSDEIVEHADLETKTVQYTYEDTDCFVFMCIKHFEEVRVSKIVVDNSKFLLEGRDVKLLLFRDKIIAVELPTIVEYTVVSLDINKSKQGDQQATIDSGATVMVPLFIEVGTRIRVNTNEGVYVERAEQQSSS